MSTVVKIIAFIFVIWLILHAEPIIQVIILVSLVILVICSFIHDYVCKKSESQKSTKSVSSEKSAGKTQNIKQTSEANFLDEDIIHELHELTALSNKLPINNEVQLITQNLSKLFEYMHQANSSQIGETTEEYKYRLEVIIDVVEKLKDFNEHPEHYEGIESKKQDAINAVIDFEKQVLADIREFNEQNMLSFHTDIQILKNKSSHSKKEQNSFSEQNIVDDKTPNLQALNKNNRKFANNKTNKANNKLLEKEKEDDETKINSVNIPDVDPNRPNDDARKLVGVYHYADYILADYGKSVRVFDKDGNYVGQKSAEHPIGNNRPILRKLYTLLTGIDAPDGVTTNRIGRLVIKEINKRA